MSDERESLDRQRVRFVREVTRHHMLNGGLVPEATAIEGMTWALGDVDESSFDPFYWHCRFPDIPVPDDFADWPRAPELVEWLESQDRLP